MSSASLPPPALGIGRPPSPTTSVVVFACGEALRGDDSVAGLVVATLPPRARSAADVRAVGTLEIEDLVDLPPEQPVVIVDAVAGVDPGELVVIDLADLGRYAERIHACSSHQLGLDAVVGLAACLREAPVRGRFCGLGIGSVEAGAALGPPVRAGLPGLRAAVAAAVTSLAAGSLARGPEWPQPPSRASGGPIRVAQPPSR